MSEGVMLWLVDFLFAVLVVGIWMVKVRSYHKKRKEVNAETDILLDGILWILVMFVVLVSSSDTVVQVNIENGKHEHYAPKISVEQPRIRAGGVWRL